MKELIKLKMHEFIFNLMKQDDRSELFVSEVKDAVHHVSRLANLMLYDEFDDTLESVLEVVLRYPEDFILSKNASRIILKNPEALKSDVWQIPESVKDAIKEHLKKYDFPTMLAGVDIEQSEENKKYICKDTEYIDWLWDILKRHSIVSTGNVEKARNGKDVANISRIFNLYLILSRYYRENLMSCYEGKGTGYIFYYTRNTTRRYFVISEETVEGEKVYAATTCRGIDKAPYFPDVALGVPCITLEKKYKLLEECKKIFTNTRNIDIDYGIIKDALDNAYGKNDDDDR